MHFAYFAQKRCDPYGTPEYFEALCDIANALEIARECPSSLQGLVVHERSHGRFTIADVKQAIANLGFGADNALRVDYDDDVDDEFLISAWRDALRRSWTDPNVLRRAEINDSFRYIAMYRHSPKLVQLVEDEATYGMTPDKAYQTLEVPLGVDEEMLITVYNMRVGLRPNYLVNFFLTIITKVEDQPSSLDRMREAVRVIAEYQQSERLQAFLKTGTDRKFPCGYGPVLS